MSKFRTIGVAFMNGFAAGFGSVLILAILGFLVGIVAVLRREPVSAELSSGFSATIALLGYSLGFWGLPTGLIGALIGLVVSITLKMSPAMKGRTWSVATLLVLVSWVLVAQIPRFPVHDALFQPSDDLTPLLILVLYVVLTLIAAAGLAFRIEALIEPVEHARRAQPGMSA
ncbi:MAG TPA: hypothetical protein PLC98_16130 [Anaerolineales bacterium]|nr:hypothetical protein [Anaerolineales bacterium]